MTTPWAVSLFDSRSWDKRESVAMIARSTVAQATARELPIVGIDHLKSLKSLRW